MAGFLGGRHSQTRIASNLRCRSTCVAFAPLILVLSIVVTVSTTAAIIHVPDGQPTIQTGIDAASAGATVLVACGTYYEHDISMKPGVVLSGETGEPGCVSIDAMRLGRGILITGADHATHIEGLTTRNALAAGTDYGGGIHCNAVARYVLDVFSIV